MYEVKTSNLENSTNSSELIQGGMSSIAEEMKESTEVNDSESFEVISQDNLTKESKEEISTKTLIKKRLHDSNNYRDPKDFRRIEMERIRARRKQIEQPRSDFRENNARRRNRIDPRQFYFNF